MALVKIGGPGPILNSTEEKMRKPDLTKQKFAQIQWRDHMSHFISLISPVVSLLLLSPGGGGGQGPPGG